MGDEKGGDKGKGELVLFVRCRVFGGREGEIGWDFMDK